MDKLWCFYHRWIVAIGLYIIYIYTILSGHPHIFTYIFYVIIVYIICYPGHPHMFTYVYICTRPCHPPPPPTPHGMGPIYWPHMRSSPSPPVVWWRYGAVPLPPCGVVGVWYGMLGMYGVYGRSGMACLESMVCLVCMVGMVCMAWVVGIVWMVGMVCKSVGYGMFDMTVCMVCMVCMITMMVWHISYVRYVWYVWHVCLLL